MSLDCAKKYAEGKINDILNQAIIDAYSAGYNVGYQDGYKKAEKETILEEMKYVDLARLTRRCVRLGALGVLVSGLPS